MAIPPIRRFYLNTVWGHIIYQPIDRPKFRLPYGMKTLKEFMDWYEEKFNQPQKERDHPIALEIYCSIVLPRTLTRKEVRDIQGDLILILNGLGYNQLPKFMAWGDDVEVVDEELADTFEARLRISKDGEDFVEKDISEELSHIKNRLR